MAITRMLARPTATTALTGLLEASSSEPARGSAALALGLGLAGLALGDAGSPAPALLAERASTAAAASRARTSRVAPASLDVVRLDAGSRAVDSEVAPWHVAGSRA